jgi:hypothetical protein
MRKLRLLLVIGMALGLALTLGAVPAFAADPVAVSVDAPSPVAPGSSIIARVNTTEVVAFAAVEFIVNFDSTVLTVTDVTDGMFQPDSKVVHVDGYTTPFGGDPNKMKVLASWPPLYPGITGAGYFCDIHFDVIGAPGSSSSVDLTNGLIADENGMPVEATWAGTIVEVAAAEPKILMSGTYEADCSVPPCPPGFMPKDDFSPGECISVWGYGFMPDMVYEIYIQPYEEGVSVAEGQPLDPTAGIPLGYPVPVPVIAAPDGTIGPIELFCATEEHVCMYWEIVADNVAGMSGIYNEAEDGLDAVALDEYGFHVIPEALTIILLGGGLAGLGSYIAARRRKGAVRDA